MLCESLGALWEYQGEYSLDALANALGTLWEYCDNAMVTAWEYQRAVLLGLAGCDTAS